MTLVDLSPDLSKLIDEEFDLEIRDGNLLVHHIPYVDRSGEVAYGTLVSELTTNGERTVAPGRHEIALVGGVPHDHQGNKISIVIEESAHDFGDGLIGACRLSGKPHNRMPSDYHEKVSNYVEILGRFARAIDPAATHKGYPARESSEDESVFRYHDAATSRFGLSAVNAKLALEKVAIVGLGGTGSYILDLIAKTPIEELHLFDDDVLYAHNVFRAPGAVPLQTLTATPLKVDHYAEKYGVFRRNIVPHPLRVDEGNVDQLAEMSFVFLAMDAGPAKRVIIERLCDWQCPFVDCGMGMGRVENSLRGTVRVTTGTADHYEHLSRRVSYTDVNEDAYDRNIQTAELNMANAAMAVIKWKKLCGYYIDTKEEFNSTFVLARNQLISGEVPS